MAVVAGSQFLELLVAIEDADAERCKGLRFLSRRDDRQAWTAEREQGRGGLRGGNRDPWRSAAGAVLRQRLAQVRA